MNTFTLSFNKSIAEKLKSADCAVVYNHILFWLTNNFNKKINQIDGKTWMYETAQQMADHFGYMNEQEVKKCLVKLVESGMIIRDYKSKNKFDRTAWYTLPNNSNNLFDGSKENFPKVTIEPCSIEDKHTDKQEMLCSPIGDGASRPPDSVSHSIPHEVEKPDFKGNSRLIRKNDVFYNACKTHKDWTTSEIEAAWVILVGYEKISDPIELMAGIIKKMRVKDYNENQINKINKEKSCQSAKDSSHQKKPSVTINGIISEPGISGRHLENWRDLLKS